MGGRVRSILLGLEVRPAGKLCHCKHNARHRIAKGELRLVVKDPGAVGTEQGYCATCGLAMLYAARSVLEAQVERLGGSVTEPGR